VNFIPKNKFDLLVNKHQSDCYYETLTSWNQLMTMLFGVFSRCDSMGKICDGMHDGAKHLGLGVAPYSTKKKKGKG